MHCVADSVHPQVDGNLVAKHQDGSPYCEHVAHPVLPITPPTSEALSLLHTGMPHITLHGVYVLQGRLDQAPTVGLPPTPLRSVTTVWSPYVTAW
jgi:hypothetical protein